MTLMVTKIYILEFLKLSSVFVYLCSSFLPLVVNASGMIILSVARCPIGTGNQISKKQNKQTPTRAIDLCCMPPPAFLLQIILGGTPTTVLRLPHHSPSQETT